MSSAILAIYDALAATTVSDGVTDIEARDIDAQPNSLNTAIAPLRILTVLDPLAGTQRARSDTAWGAMGGSGFYRVDWVLYDVLYHTPLFQGRGVMDVNTPLLTYQANYYAMISGALQLPANVALLSMTMQPSVLEYPLRSGNWYYAVRGTLAIQETICP
jgi:hypothetical protein